MSVGRPKRTRKINIRCLIYYVIENVWNYNLISYDIAIKKQLLRDIKSPMQWKATHNKLISAFHGCHSDRLCLEIFLMPQYFDIHLFCDPLKMTDRSSWWLEHSKVKVETPHFRLKFFASFAYRCEASALPTVLCGPPQQYFCLA